MSKLYRTELKRVTFDLSTTLTSSFHMTDTLESNYFF